MFRIAHDFSRRWMVILPEARQVAARMWEMLRLRCVPFLRAWRSVYTKLTALFKISKDHVAFRSVLHPWPSFG